MWPWQPPSHQQQIPFQIMLRARAISRNSGKVPRKYSSSARGKYLSNQAFWTDTSIQRLRASEPNTRSNIVSFPIQSINSWHQLVATPSTLSLPILLTLTWLTLGAGTTSFQLPLFGCQPLVFPQSTLGNYHWFLGDNGSVTELEINHQTTELYKISQKYS